MSGAARRGDALRPIADIVADMEAPTPDLDFIEWDWFCERVTPAEIADWKLDGWLDLCARYRGHGALTIPAAIAEDPRLTSPARYVLAALLEVGRDVDTASAEAETAVVARLFGACADYIDRGVVADAVRELVAVGCMSRTTRGGFVRRAA